MSLIKCKDCGHEMSASAKACPKCGAKVPKIKWWLWIPLSLIAGFFFIGFLAHDPVMSAKDDKSKEFASYVKRMMKDPQSFEVLELRRSNLDATCVKFRAKNSFNAYIQGNAVKAPDGKTHIDGIKGPNESLYSIYCMSGGGVNVYVRDSSL
jgi:hypothetical protein